VKHTIKGSLLTRTVEIALVGCGGNGSLMLTELAKISTALVELGHQGGGFNVTVFDPDTVSASNISRQNFYPSDIGQNKAVVLANRVNLCFPNLKWKAAPDYFRSNSLMQYRPHIVISCVDSKTARREIAKAISGVTSSYSRGPQYWLDMGNRLSDGQVILGEPPALGETRKKNPMRLPCVTELYPEIMDESIPEDEDTPTCSLAEALERQDLFICRSVATFASQLLWTLFRKGGVDNHGSFINLASGFVTPLAVDPAAWRRFEPVKPKRVRKKKATEPKAEVPTVVPEQQ